MIKTPPYLKRLAQHLDRTVEKLKAEGKDPVEEISNSSSAKEIFKEYMNSNEPSRIALESDEETYLKAEKKFKRELRVFQKFSIALIQKADHAFLFQVPNSIETILTEREGRKENIQLNTSKSQAFDAPEKMINILNDITTLEHKVEQVFTSYFKEGVRKQNTIGGVNLQNMNQDNAIDTLDEFTSEALDSEEIEANIHRPEDMKKQFRQTLELEESGLEELEEELEKLIQYLMSRMMGMPMDMKEIKELAHKLNLTTILNKILEIEKQQNQERRVDRPFDHSPGASEEEKKNNYPKPTMGNP